jgi:hypothetical protein
MLFMVMHKVNAEIEAGGPPRPELVKDMGQLIGEAVQSGRMRDGAGLKAAGERVRLKFSGGKRSVEKGPYRGQNELISSFAKLEVKNMDEAVEWGTRYAQALGAEEVEVGTVTEPWDIGVAPKPEGPVPLHVLVLNKATAASEAGKPHAPEAVVKLNALFDDMKRAGVYQGARLHAVGGKHTWTDGPFAESKELVSGYCILDFASLEEAKAWTTRYAKILGDIEVDVREVYVV